MPAATPEPAPVAAPAPPPPTAPPTPVPTAAPASRPAPAIPVPQTNAPPAQPTGAPVGFGQVQSALDALGGFWLPTALVVLVLLAAAAYLLRPRRSRGATVWTEEGGWVSISDAEAATLQRFQPTDAAAGADVPEEEAGPVPSPAGKLPAQGLPVLDPPPARRRRTAAQHPALVPHEPSPESTVPPLISSVARSAAAAAAPNGAGAVALRSAAGPTPTRTAHPRPRHRPELKVHHHQTGGPHDPGPPSSPEAALRRFVEDWSGVPVDTDGAPHPGMTLLRAYARQVLGAPPLWGAPMDIQDTYDMGHYAWVRESPYRAPAPGDAIVWAPAPEDSSTGGQVAIFLSGDANGFDAFDASGSAPAVRHHADYRGVVGWLHPIGG